MCPWPCPVASCPCCPASMARPQPSPRPRMLWCSTAASLTCTLCSLWPAAGCSRSWLSRQGLYSCSLLLMMLSAARLFGWTWPSTKNVHVVTMMHCFASTHFRGLEALCLRGCPFMFPFFHLFFHPSLFCPY